MIRADHDPDVIVVGAGISGLTAAWRLQHNGLSVEVLEASDAVGGRMISSRRDGFIINHAAGVIPRSYAALLELISELGLSDRIWPIDTSIAIPRAGTTHRIRANGLGMLLDGVRTQLLSTKSKLLLRHLILDAFRARRALRYEDPAAGAAADRETVGGYCQRRLNPEIKQYLIEPLLRGLFVIEPDDISVVELFFVITKVLGRGQMAYTGGIDFLCRVLAERLDVRTDTVVSHVERDEHGVNVTWTQNGTERTERAAGCVIAVSGTDLPQLYPQLDPVQREILTQRIDFKDTIVGHFALNTRPPETALLTAFPTSEQDGLSLVAFHHITAPDCAPEGKGLVSGYWMHDWSVRHMHLGDHDIVEEMLPALGRVVPDIAEHVEFSHIDRWHPVVVNCHRGIYTLLAEFIHRTNPTDRVQLAGDWYGYANTNRCTLIAQNAADQLAHTLARQPQPTLAHWPKDPQR